jgi:hypothetical protein
MEKRVGGVEVLLALPQLIVDGLQLLVGGLQLLVGGLQLVLGLLDFPLQLAIGRGVGEGGGAVRVPPARGAAGQPARKRGVLLQRPQRGPEGGLELVELMGQQRLIGVRVPWDRW